MTSRGTLKVLLVLTLCLMAGYFLIGRNGYGLVSDDAYELATAIYSTCNRQDAVRLPNLTKLVVSAEYGAKITSSEAQMLQGIVEIAQAGDWHTAANEAQQLMRDQVRYP
jgi:hypothetical protein